ncbi:hypothetical protein AKJ09_07944 [Labilithrix luteola]|uniref:Uncharacterized protein n=1 Tax=Labilithrix luteola TaxID=1391654 RepID=A0A0K1Q640_9BACT|nr:hypothetical protein AKJ09_07944 [Labilithrix luteola]
MRPRRYKTARRRSFGLRLDAPLGHACRMHWSLRESRTWPVRDPWSFHPT